MLFSYRPCALRAAQYDGFIPEPKVFPGTREMASIYTKKPGTVVYTCLPSTGDTVETRGSLRLASQPVWLESSRFNERPRVHITQTLTQPQLSLKCLLITIELAQQGKAFAAKPDNFEFNLWDQHDRGKEPTPTSCPQISAHSLCHTHAHTHTLSHTKGTKEYTGLERFLNEEHWLLWLRAQV
jgi:hypothetical protein